MVLTYTVFTTVFLKMKCILHSFRNWKSKVKVFKMAGGKRSGSEFRRLSGGFNAADPGTADCTDPGGGGR